MGGRAERGGGRDTEIGPSIAFMTRAKLVSLEIPGGVLTCLRLRAGYRRRADGVSAIAEGQEGLQTRIFYAF